VEHVDGERRRRRHDEGRVVGRRPGVEADQAVEVDGPPLLELRHLDVLDLDRALDLGERHPEDLTVEILAPPPPIAAKLGLDPNTDLCVARRRVRYVDGRPGIISDDYFDERIVRGTELAEPEDTTREDILKEAGYPQTYHVDEIMTRMPTPDEARRLSLSPGTPVAQLTRTGYTQEGKPVRVMVSIVPGDTLILRYVTPT
jgi:GntR family transcriptional regulator